MRDREVRRKRHIAALERELATVKGDGASAQEAKAVAAAHYAQLQQMQESCAMRLAVMEEVERRLADAEAQLEDCTWEDWFNDGEHSSPRSLSMMPFRLRSGVCLWAGRCGPCVVLSIGSLIFTGWGVLCVWLPTFCRLRNL